MATKKGKQEPSSIRIEDNQNENNGQIFFKSVDAESRDQGVIINIESMSSQTQQQPPQSSQRSELHRDQRKQMIAHNVLKQQSHQLIDNKNSSSQNSKHRRSLSDNDEAISDLRIKKTESDQLIKSCNNPQVRGLSPSNEVSIVLNQQNFQQAVAAENVMMAGGFERVRRDSQMAFLKFQDQVTIIQVQKKVKHFLHLTSLRVYEILLIFGNFIYKLFWILFVFGLIEQQQGTPTGYNIEVLNDSNPGDCFVAITSVICFIIQFIFQIICEGLAVMRLKSHQNIRKISLIGLKVALLFELIGFIFSQYYLWSTDTVYRIIGIAVFSQTFIMQGYYISKYQKIHDKIELCENNYNINPLIYYS